MKYVNGASSSAPQSSVDAASAAAGRSERKRFTRFAEMPYINAATVPAATAAPTLEPATFPLAKMATPTRPPNNAMARWEPMRSPNSANAANAANGTAMLLEIAPIPAGARSAPQANSRNGSVVLIAPMPMIASQRERVKRARSRSRNGSNTSAPSARRTSTSGSGPKSFAATRWNRNEPPQMAANATSTAYVRVSPLPGNRARRPPRGLRCCGRSTCASRRAVSGLMMWPCMNIIPPAILANSFNMASFSDVACLTLEAQDMAAVRLAVAIIFPTRLDKFRNGTRPFERLAGLRRGRAGAEPDPRRRTPAHHRERAQPPDAHAGTTRGLSPVRARFARADAHRGGPHVARQRGAAYRGDRTRAAAIVRPAFQCAESFRHALDGIELAAAAAAAVRETPPGNGIEPGFLDRTGGFRRRPFRCRAAIRACSMAGRGVGAAVRRVADAGCESRAAERPQTAAAGSARRMAAALSGRSVAGMVHHVRRQAAEALCRLLQRFGDPPARGGGRHRHRTRPHYHGETADRGRHAGRAVSAGIESALRALPRLSAALARAHRLHRVS